MFFYCFVIPTLADRASVMRRFTGGVIVIIIIVVVVVVVVVVVIFLQMLTPQLLVQAC